MSHEGRGSGECDTRKRVMKAALEEFNLRGYKGASTKLIAERAGVNEVTIFRHFGSKMELLRTAAEETFKELGVPILSEEYLKLPLREGLHKILYDFLEKAPVQTDIFMLGMTESFSNPEIAQHFKEFSWLTRVKLKEYFRLMYTMGKLKEADFSALAHIILSSFYSVVLIRHRAPEKVRLEVTEEGVIETLIAGIVCAYGTETES